MDPNGAKRSALVMHTEKNGGVMRFSVVLNAGLITSLNTTIIISSMVEALFPRAPRVRIRSPTEIQRGMGRG